VPGKNISPFYNWLSLAGFIVATNSLILILVLYIKSVTASAENAYLGLFIYIILPVFLVLGLILVPLGVYLTIRRLKLLPRKRNYWPVLDLNSRSDKATAVKIILITIVFIVLTGIGSYRAYEYTNSNDFCGKVCHEVEEPAFVTYQHSAHARVACVDCHVGTGNGWSVKSKLSGLYQVYSTLFNRYSRPIASPIHSLRPDRETCENCHWPEKLSFRKLLIKKSYLADSANTEWNLSLLMKMGPDSSKHPSKGIHWHMDKNFNVEYISDNPKLESIPWVKLTNLATGEVKIFRDEKNVPANNTLESQKMHTMDCMDCHNRASHSYKSAAMFVDAAMSSGVIPKNLPYFKIAAMEAAKIPINAKGNQLNQLRESVLNYYQSEHPELYTKEKARIDHSIQILQCEYSSNVFPAMRAEASQFPDFRGHLESAGCFRCHSGNHKTTAGEIIPHDCETCHSIIAQGPSGEIANAYMGSSLQFMHPTKINAAELAKSCSDCHTDLYR
jgi:nitrate/TMAO reductase-like tetraheme cytochrome c subunit